MKAFRLFYLVGSGLGLVLLAPSIVAHTLWLMGGEGLPFILRGRWDIVSVNAAFFLLFLLLLRYRRQVDWRSRNVYAAFILALFAEMYGFPLTAYFAARYLGAVEVDYRPSYSLNVGFMGVEFTLPTMMIVGGFVTVVGLALVVLGWYEIYRHREGLVTSGVYRYSRNPQYLGMMLVASGWILHWPTLLTLLMYPLLAATYYRLSREEEALMEKLYPKEFREYRRDTPMFL